MSLRDAIHHRREQKEMSSQYLIFSDKGNPACNWCCFNMLTPKGKETCLLERYWRGNALRKCPSTFEKK